MPFRVLPILSLILALTGATEAAQDQETVLGTPSTIRPPAQEGETLVVAAGARLRERPHGRSPVIEILDTPLELPVLDRRGPWVRVRFGNWQGWFRPDGKSSGLDEELPLTFETDDERLVGAHSLVRGDVGPRAFGSFILYTDVVDEKLLDWLSAVAADVPRAYRERFDLDPGSQVGEVVVLFAEEADYREFEAADTRIAMAHSRGYTSEGLSVLFWGAHDRASLVSVLIHELTHLLNRRVFRTATQPWLEEGMAEDLAFCRVSEEGLIRLGTLAGETTEEYENWFTLSGPLAHLAALFAAKQSPSAPDLESLVSMNWFDFIKPETRGLHYAESAMLLRFLSDGGNRKLETGYRRYLKAVAEAELATSPSLWDTLDASPDQVGRGLYRFIQQQAGANGIETE